VAYPFRHFPLACGLKLPLAADDDIAAILLNDDAQLWVFGRMTLALLSVPFLQIRLFLCQPLLSIFTFRHLHLPYCLFFVIFSLFPVLSSSNQFFLLYLPSHALFFPNFYPPKSATVCFCHLSLTALYSHLSLCVSARGLCNRLKFLLLLTFPL
jgi:hypothetical protein